MEPKSSSCGLVRANKMNSTFQYLYSQSRRNRDVIIPVFLAAWVFYYLGVLLTTGFISDDSYASQLKGMLLNRGVLLHEAFFSQISGWIFGSGRFLIIGELMAYVTYYITQNTVIVKAINISVILVGIILFYFFTKRETRSSNIALLACLLIPLFFQFRLWHDPILAFTFLIPMAFALVIGSLVLFQLHLDSGRSGYYIAGAFLFTVSLITYEVSYPLSLLFIIVAYSRNDSIFRAIKQSMLFLVPTIVLIAASAAIRINLASQKINSTYNGAEFHLDLNKIISALEIQLSASFPLSYYIFNKENLTANLFAIDYLFLTIFLASIALLIYKIGKSLEMHMFRSWITIGVIMLFTSATLAALSGHQIELIQAGYGFGYITVYFQYFGVCILTVALLVYLARTFDQRWLLLFAILVSTGFTIVAAQNLKLNRAVASKSNEFYVYPRQLLQSALDAGIADEMKDDSFLFRTMRYPSDWIWFYSTVTNKKLQTCELAGNVGFATCIANMQRSTVLPETIPPKSSDRFEFLDLSAQEAWILSYNFAKKTGDSGRVILGKVDGVVQNSVSKTAIQIIVSNIKLYDLKKDKIRSLTLGNKPINFLKILPNETEDMTQVKPYDFENLQVNSVGFEWLGKIHGLEGTIRNNLRWSSGSATLTLHNLSRESRWVDLQMELGTPMDQPSKLTIKYPTFEKTLIISQTRTRYIEKLLLAPGSVDIQFTSDGKPIQNGDPRSIVFGIFNFNISEY